MGSRIMTTLQTDHLLQCIKTLETSLQLLQTTQPRSINYEVFRNATVKGFEFALETSGKLLRKALKTYMANPHFIDELTYKEVLRHAAKHGLMDEQAVKRWFIYRNNRNDTAHDYGIQFAQKTLVLLPEFLQDVKNLEKILQEKFGETDAKS